jgi:hypothetical protein
MRPEGLAMKLVWIALAASLALCGSASGATPDRCPPQKARAAKAAHTPSHHHRKHRAVPRYYEDEYAPLPPPPPPPPPPVRVWHDGYGKPYAVGPRPWMAPPPCPCPPDRRGGDFCRFDVWYGFDSHYGLESGL